VTAGAPPANIDYALEALERNVKKGCRSGTRQRQVAGAGACRIQEIGKRVVGRCAVDGDDGWRTHQLANRFETFQRIIIHLSQMRNDEQARRSDQETAAVGRRARDGFDADQAARTRTVFDHHRGSMRLSDLIGQQANQDIRTAARLERNDDSGGSRRLRPRSLNEQSEQEACNDGKNASFQHGHAR
jgi:hypothetical protein